MGQLTTLSFFKYKTLKQKAWAFKMMQFAHSPMGRVEGLTFYKLMGSGKDLGFNPWPDWSTYAILQIWQDKKYADAYLENELFTRYRQNSQAQWVIYLEHVTSKGTWSGVNPFTTQAGLNENDPLAVITRATIKWREMPAFWKYVPTAQTGIAENPALIFTKGIGEAPFRQMATFSIWQNQAALREFAYERKEHAKAIRLTRERNWYVEEMFARFRVSDSYGAWPGVNLADLRLNGTEE